ncbi:20115_t:CDS:1, partial [Dentiscutata erythropus]
KQSILKIQPVLCCSINQSVHISGVSSNLRNINREKLKDLVSPITKDKTFIF